MLDTGAHVESIAFRRVFPWLHLFRAFGIAVDIRKIMLAGMGVSAR